LFNLYKSEDNHKLFQISPVSACRSSADYNNLLLRGTDFQEFIRDVIDIRITVVGDSVFAAESKIPPYQYQYDMRMSPTIWKHHKLPLELGEITISYMKTLGLEYGAIDMKLRDNGEYFFLEINPSGAFLFVETYAKLPISDTLARHLAIAER
jgi:glutathione synthase/RimK-type ligase-like ATP-grasp enzyme